MCPLGEGRISKVNHKLSPEDMRKLYASDTFSLVNPKSLQRKVFFDVMFYLRRRGRENLRTVKKSDFSLKVDEKGDYIEKVNKSCLLYTSPSPRDKRQSRMPSSA